MVALLLLTALNADPVRNSLLYYIDSCVGVSVCVCVCASMKSWLGQWLPCL